jgi:hypothetical protein
VAASPPAPTPPPAPVEAEVSFDQAPAEENLGAAPTPDSPVAQKEESPREIIETLQPKSAPHKWVIGPEDMRREYVQRQLSFIGKMQWFALVGDVLDRALSGPSGMSLNSFFNAPQAREGSLSMEDFRDADTFVQAVGKLLAVAPDFLLKSYCIWLAVPDYEQDLAITLMKMPEQDGGLTDDAGMEIIEIFIDQNYEALHNFFTKRLGQLQKRVQARIEATRS